MVLRLYVLENVYISHAHIPHSSNQRLSAYYMYYAC